MRMSYRQYKTHYSDCKAHDYDPIEKTIEVDIPYGRLKASGTRGKKYDTYILKATDGENVFVCDYRAITFENAEKQHVKYCKENFYTPVSMDTELHGTRKEVIRLVCDMQDPNGAVKSVTFKALDRRECEKKIVDYLFDAACKPYEYQAWCSFFALIGNYFKELTPHEKWFLSFNCIKGRKPE